MFLRVVNVIYVKNILGEVGGYMGLLIGASTLTIIEILDLIIYNFFLKLMDYRHRQKAVSVVVKPSSNPIDNTDFKV